MCDTMKVPLRHFPDLDQRDPEHRLLAKEQMTAFVCGPIKEGHTKSNDSLEYLSFLALDNDNQITNKDLNKELEAMGLNFLLYPTASNGTKDLSTNRIKHGCRALIEIDYSITPERFNEIRPKLQELFPWADIGAMKASQFFLGNFTMANMDKNYKTIYQHVGKPLETRAIPKHDERPRDAKRRSLKNSGVVLHTSNTVEFDDNMVFYGKDSQAYTFDDVLNHQMCASKWHCPWCEGSSGKPNAYFYIAPDGNHTFQCNHSNKGCGVFGVYRQSSVKLANNIEAFNAKQNRLSTRRGKGPKRTIATEQPIPYTELSEMIIQAIGDISGDVTILAGYEGIGKSRFVHHLVAKGEKIYFASSSYAQAREQYSGLVKAGQKQGFTVGLFVSKGEMLKQAGYDIEYNKSNKSYMHGKIKRQKIIQSIMEVDGIEELEATKIFKEITPKPLSEYEQYDVIVMTHDMLETFSSRQSDLDKFMGELSKEYDVLDDSRIVYYDDPKASDFFNLTVSEELDSLQYEQKLIEGKTYTLRPANKRRLINLSNRLIFSTTETLCRDAIKQTYHDMKINEPGLYFHKRLCCGNAHVVVSKKVRSKNHKIFKYIKTDYFEKQTGESWELIGNGIEQELNFSTINGRNELQDSNILLKLSYPHPKVIELVRANFPQLSKAEACAVIEIDQLNQAIGRNQGYRFRDKQMVIYMEPAHYEVILDQCRYSFNTVTVEDEFQSTRNDTGMVKLIGDIALAVEPDDLITEDTHTNATQGDIESFMDIMELKE